MYYRDEGPGVGMWIFAIAILLILGYTITEETRDDQRVAGGKVDRENVLVVFPEQLRQ